MASTSPSWCIVGGGMLGLTLARRLAQRGHQVTLFEAAPQLGGLASAWELGDVTWDRHYHVTLLSDAHLRRVSGRARAGPRDALGGDAHRLLQRRPALLGLELASSSSASRPCA